MFLIRDVYRMMAGVVGYAVRGGRVGVLLLVALGVVVIALSTTVSAAVPIAIYPFL